MLCNNLVKTLKTITSCKPRLVRGYDRPGISRHAARLINHEKPTPNSAAVIVREVTPGEKTIATGRINWTIIARPIAPATPVAPPRTPNPTAKICRASHFRMIGTIGPVEPGLPDKSDSMLDTFMISLLNNQS